MARNQSSARTATRRGTRADSEALWDWNLESDRIHFSPRWIALAGCDDHEVGSQPADWFQRVHPDDRAQLLHEIETARAGDAKAFACRYRLRHKDGTYRWMSCRGKVIRGAGGQAIRLTGSQSDVTVETVTDRLTGLPNRLLLVDRVTQSIERARRYKAFHFALIVIHLGRPARGGKSSRTTSSDPLLTAVARRLEKCLRIPGTMPSLRHNDLVARMDGDYFAILLDGLKDIGHAKVAADRILSEILTPVSLGGREVRLSASVGVAVSATGYANADQMLQDAQAAQHRASVLGGSHCEIFDTAIWKSEQDELQLEGDFDAALQRREFVLFFQPIVSLRTNEIQGFEALVRWQHPVLGIIAPLDFVPLAERTGFIVSLGNWILREACQRLSEWQTTVPESRAVSVAVNISSVQLSDPTLADHVAEALRDSGLEPRRLVLELTEGVAMTNPAAITTLLMRFRAMGVRISVDDFGTGYSSLAYLQQFPIDILKIDRSFVRGIVTNKHTAEIVAGVMNMAQQLGLHVVAEGIEYEDQCAHLRALKCDAGQGYLFATPLEVDKAADLLRTGLAPRPEAGPTAISGWRPARVSQLLVRGGRLIAGRRVALAGGALALLLSTGLILLAGRPKPAPVTSQTSATDEHQPSPITTPGVVAVPVSPPGGVAERPRSPSISPALDRKQAPKIASSPPASAPTISPPPMSLDVVHLHRLGNCRGRLEVTRDGVAFVSATGDGDEAFTLKYTEFLDGLSDDTLILRTATKTYRFKTAEQRSDSNAQLRNLANRMARSRR
jgi:diguanylate cyclase (GGDEF)-like protein